MSSKETKAFNLDKHIIEWLKQKADMDYLNVSTWLNQLLNRIKDKEDKE